MIQVNPDFPFPMCREATLERKRRAGLCPVKHCTRSSRPSRQLCERHAKALYRHRHPLRYAYENLRRSAQLRKIRFELSFLEFEKFCRETDYEVMARGCKRGAWTVDRIDSSRGYSLSNIRPLVHEENSRLGACEYHRAQAASSAEEPF